MKLALLNTSILTNEGVYSLRAMSLEEAKQMMKKNEENIESAIGHESTAQIMSELLETSVAMNRQSFSQEVGQMALIFKLNGRAPEGRVLTREEIETMGYKFQLLERLS